MTSTLSSPLTTPSGLVFPNRLIKAAMGENLTTSASDPSASHIQLYSTWSTGGWAALLTGSVNVSTVYKAGHQNVAVPRAPSAATRAVWETWAEAAQRDGTPALVQLVHPGRQCPAKSGDRGFFEKAIAPSAVKLVLGQSWLDWVVATVAFGTPREMSVGEIEEVVAQFAAAARFVQEAGFKGVEIHAAHGYLLTQFLSPKANRRTDAYGGSPAKRAKIVVDVIRAIRAVVPKSFCVGIKLNSVDVEGAENLEDSLQQVGLLVAEEIDFLEISGGTLENIRMTTGDGKLVENNANRSAKREAFFLDYAKAVRARYPSVILMVTGGFRSREGMARAIESKGCDLIGLARPAVVFPHLAKEVLLNESVEDRDAVTPFELVKPGWLMSKLPIKIIGAGVEAMYWVGQIHRLAAGQKTQPPPKA